MGLLKTGLTLAGGYGLIKAASKAVNDHEDKKQQRLNQQQQQQHQYPRSGDPAMNYPGDQMNYYPPSHPQYSPNADPGKNYLGNQMNYHPPSYPPSRSPYNPHMNMDGEHPPPPYQGWSGEKRGSAQRYYSPKN